MSTSIGERWVRERIERGDPFWPPQIAVAAAIALSLVLSGQVTVGPNWLLPTIEAVLLIVLAIVSPTRATQHSAGRRRLALAMIALVSLVNVVSLALLVHYLVNGGQSNGHRLILSGAVLLGTNVLLFAVWYWELDSGGPVARFQDRQPRPDFLFPQQQQPDIAIAGWRPGFADYLYMSLTNVTAFSPTDTMPLTHVAKLLMALQSITSLGTIGLVVSRAVNILG